MILFQMEEVWVSFGITDNIHLKGHAYLISGHDGKAQRGQDILDQKGGGGKLAEDLKKRQVNPCCWVLRVKVSREIKSRGKRKRTCKLEGFKKKKKIRNINI